MGRFLLVSAAASLLASSCLASSAAFSDSKPFGIFASEPWLRPPSLNITHAEVGKISEGNIFVAPYTTLRPNVVSNHVEACQVGPHIFDKDGELVWSGACMFQNSNVFDFKTWSLGNSTHLSFILYDRNHPGVVDNHYRGIGVVMDQTYEQRRIHVNASNQGFNMHEFTVLDGGARAVMFAQETGIVTTPDTLPFANSSALVWKGALVEFDMETEKPLFEWRFLDHIPMTESSVTPRHEKGRGEGYTEPWDWLHPNSIDKDDEGNYLLSGRLTDCIYNISGQNGTILWRLGGKNSSFVMDGFNFSRQHDIRFHSRQGNKILISLLNNAADQEGSSSALTTAAYLIELDISTSPMKAKLIRQWLRPDGRLSFSKGNVQMLDNGHVFVSWGDRGYITEFDKDGHVVFEARFMSPPFMTYRAYKLNFTGLPTEPPKVKALTYNVRSRRPLTVIHVSWNGATNVKSWKFFAVENIPGSKTVPIGTSKKDKFETTLVKPGHFPYVYVEALSGDGKVIGKSKIIATEMALGEEANFELSEHQHEEGLDATGKPFELDGQGDRPPGSEVHSWIDKERLTNYLYVLTAGLILGVIMTSLTTRFVGPLFGHRHLRELPQP